MRRGASSALFLCGLALAGPARADDLPGLDPGTAYAAELQACRDAADLAALDAVKGRIGKREQVERDLARAEQDLQLAKDRLEKARAEVRKVNDRVTQKIATLRERAHRSANGIDYYEGEIKRVVGEATTISTRIAEIDAEIARLQAIIDKTTDTSTLGIGKEAGEEKKRVAELQSERGTLWTQKMPLATEFAKLQAELAPLKAQLANDENAVLEDFNRMMTRATMAVADTERLVTGYEQEVAKYRTAAASIQMARNDIFDCIAVREAELTKQALGGSTGSDGTGDVGTNLDKPLSSTETLSASKDAATVDLVADQPQPAPGSQPFTGTGLENRTWTGTWDMTCPGKEEGSPPEVKSGVAEFSFSGGTANLLFKGFGDGGGKEEPAPVTLDPLGAFALRTAEEGWEFRLNGQFQGVSGADGSARPTGRGQIIMNVDLSGAMAAVAGMMGNALTFGASDEIPEMTPEEREKYMIRCKGGWELPPA
jgi:hypothetical protein